ncbi:MAG TPA: DUF3306 domain-containing protein [Pseudoduganella sp.]
MAAETFFARWSRRKTEAAQAEVAAPEPLEEVKPELPQPTLEQVAALAADDDFTPFVARGVDETVRRAAMKKLFSDPRFNVMDGLDTYIEDYNKFEPMTPAMIAALNHAKDLLNPLAAIEREWAASKGTLPLPSASTDGDAVAVAAGDDAGSGPSQCEATEQEIAKPGAGSDAQGAAQDAADQHAAGVDNIQATSQESNDHANQSL